MEYSTARVRTLSPVTRREAMRCTENSVRTAERRAPDISASRLSQTRRGARCRAKASIITTHSSGAADTACAPRATPLESRSSPLLPRSALEECLRAPLRVVISTANFNKIRQKRPTSGRDGEIPRPRGEKVLVVDFSSAGRWTIPGPMPRALHSTSDPSRTFQTSQRPDWVPGVAFSLA